MTAHTLRVAGLAGILAIASVRSMVLVAPSVWFDVDPARDQMPLLALGAFGSNALDIALFLSAALALLGERCAGRGVRVGFVLLSLLPVPVACVHADTGVVAENGFRSGTWIAAMLAFVALSHLVRDRTLRAIAIAVLVSLTGLLAVRGIVQVLVEHPATVAYFEETKAQFFATRGWLPDSSAALAYERRLRQPEATGWFGLSNPFSTMMGAGTVGFAALAMFSRRTQQSGNTLLLGMAACACAALLLVNGGKGAIAATLLAAVVVLVAVRQNRAPSPRWAMALAACALLAVGMRWLVGTRVGELSLLFRGYYIEGGLRIFTEPDWFLFGCGAGRLQEFFNAAKPANCPEDVQSLHSMFFDWLVAFGVSGFAWIALFSRAFWLAPTAESDTTPSADDERRAVRSAKFIPLLACALGVIIASAVERPIVDAFWIGQRIVGITAFTLLATCAVHAAMAISSVALRTIALALGALVLVHAQIETVAWMPGSCVLALACMACATNLPSEVSANSPIASGRSPARPTVRWMVALGFGVIALCSFAFGAVRTRSTEARLDEVARALAPVSNDRTHEYELRMNAAQALKNGYWRTQHSLEAGVEQALLAAAAAERDAGGQASTSSQKAEVAAGEQEIAALELARDIAWTRQLRGPRADALRADVALVMLRRMFASGGATNGARSDALARWNEFALVSTIEDGAKAMPRNPRRWIAVGEARSIVRDALLAEQFWSVAEDVRDPREAYKRALEVNAALALDPLAQLSPRELATVEQQLGRGRDAPSHGENTQR
ncbi:MAG: hypothetical protein QM516_08640 [Limnohabitans sp.]|nr:hypothetical protein [Limnohabitans sp.]